MIEISKSKVSKYKTYSKLFLGFFSSNLTNSNLFRMLLIKHMKKNWNEDDLAILIFVVDKYSHYYRISFKDFVILFFYLNSKTKTG